MFYNRTLVDLPCKYYGGYTRVPFGLSNPPPLLTLKPRHSGHSEEIDQIPHFVRNDYFFQN